MSRNFAMIVVIIVTVLLWKTEGRISKMTHLS